MAGGQAGWEWKKNRATPSRASISWSMKNHFRFGRHPDLRRRTPMSAPSWRSPWKMAPSAKSSWPTISKEAAGPSLKRGEVSRLSRIVPMRTATTSKRTNRRLRPRPLRRRLGWAPWPPQTPPLDARPRRDPIVSPRRAHRRPPHRHSNRRPFA